MTSDQNEQFLQKLDWTFGAVLEGPKPTDCGAALWAKEVPPDDLSESSCPVQEEQQRERKPLEKVIGCPAESWGGGRWKGPG